MQPDDLPQLVAIGITIALLVIAGRRYGSDWLNLMKQLGDELMQRMPVYSAETTARRKEAEFIRDRAPKKHSARMFLLLIVVLGAAAWWLTN